MSDCIEWHKARERTGYGVTWYEGRKARAHRVAWIKANGPIPDGLFVLHKCDNPSCVNVDHLFLGTHTDNMRDKIAKGRMRLDGKKYRGGYVKVKEEEIPKIRAMRGLVKNVEIARMYGVDPSTVSRIMTGSNWGDLL